MVGSRDGWDLDSDRVDEDMIILRKRIHEIRITEESISEPSGWMEWEKEYYMTAAYASDVYELVGLLQRFLMNTRPSLAIGTVLLVLLSVPTSLGFLLHRLLIALGSMLSALHTS
ncbi:mediator of RNA polymerase II transcription subunit [Rhynchospora pubera]|nr:mediator of RNA polymerase II transcription subunit [Rhynchospora pubera]